MGVGIDDSRTIRNTLNGIGYLDLVLPYGFTATLKANVNTRNSDYYKYENAVIGDARGTVSEDGSISGRNGALAKTPLYLQELDSTGAAALEHDL